MNGPLTSGETAAALSYAALAVLAKLRRTDRPKPAPPINRWFRSDAAHLVAADAGHRVLEFPIPVAAGFAFYGTFHCVAPRVTFHIQRRLLTVRQRHLHYEIHPIELACDDTIAAHPWLPTAAGRGASRRRWLERRLAAVVGRRRVVTLGQISRAYFSLCQ